MAHDTAYNFDPITPSQETRELYTNVGSSNFQLGLGARGFKGGTDLEIWDSAVAGTQLVENTDYEIVEIDTRNSPNAGFNIYTRVKVLNPTYQTGNIYITYKVVLSYVDAVFTNDTRTIAKSAGGSSIKYLTSIDSPYTIIDGDGLGKYICDSSGGNINIILPTLADNQNRVIEVVHQIPGNVVSVDGEGVETIDALLSIDLPKQRDRIKITGTLSEWAITEEKISSQLILNTFAGYGSVDNKIARFTNLKESFGNMFTENHSTGYNGNQEGLEITINRTGKYSFGWNMEATANYLGISVNSTQLTINIQLINIDDRACMNYANISNSVNFVGCTATLNKDDVVRLHTSGAGTTQATFAHVIVAYV